MRTRQNSERAYLGDGLGLVGLLGGVRSNALSLDPLGLSILLIVGAEEIDFVVVLIGSSSGGSILTTDEGLTGGAGSSKIGVLSSVGLDVLVPPGNVGVGSSIRSSLDGLENKDVGLGRGITAFIIRVLNLIVSRKRSVRLTPRRRSGWRGEPRAC